MLSLVPGELEPNRHALVFHGVRVASTLKIKFNFSINFTQLNSMSARKSLFKAEF